MEVKNHVGMCRRHDNVNGGKNSVVVRLGQAVLFRLVNNPKTRLVP